MELDQFTKQSFRFQKSAFNHAIDLITNMQEQTEKFTQSWANKNGFLPGQNLKIMTQWCEACKQGLEEYKKFVNDSFDKVENFMVAIPMPKEAATVKSKGEEKPATKKEGKKETEPEKEKK